ncbi:alpha/beta hydrolase [Candidatus Obscuribacterales bacterium]|nr:alpha/beta hydrolase [Candidatus Obscuribacterales bacterium]
MKKRTSFLIGFSAGCLATILFGASLVVWFCCPAANPALVNVILFRPLKVFDEFYGKELAGVRAEEVNITSSDGVRLFGRFYKQKGATKVVLYNHGNGGNVSMPYCLYKINSLLSTGVSVLAYDYRGYGKSTGTPSIDGVVDDSAAAFNYLLRRGIKNDQIIVYGESLGAGVSSALCKRIDCAGVVLESGFSSVEALGKEKFDLFKLYPSWMFPKQFDNDSFVVRHHPPLLIVAGKLDEVIPWHHSQYLFDHATKPAQFAVYEDCHHAFFQKKQSDFDARLKTFFEQCGTKIACAN